MNLHVHAEEKLAILQEADRFRKWKSLDDKRVCLLCDRTFTGRQLNVTRDRRGRYQLHCPTEECRSTAHEWVHPGNPLLSQKAWKDWSRAMDDGDSAPGKSETRPAADYGQAS